MTQHDKDILLAKIDTLHYSLADVQLQAITTLVRDLIISIEVTSRDEMGFKKGEQPCQSLATKK